MGNITVVQDGGEGTHLPGNRVDIRWIDTVSRKHGSHAINREAAHASIHSTWARWACHT